MKNRDRIAELERQVSELEQRLAVLEAQPKLIQYPQTPWLWFVYPTTASANYPTSYTPDAPQPLQPSRPSPVVSF